MEKTKLIEIIKKLLDVDVDLSFLEKLKNRSWIIVYINSNTNMEERS